MSLHRPKAAARDRAPDGEEFRELKRLRDAFWARAHATGTPTLVAQLRQRKPDPKDAEAKAQHRLDLIEAGAKHTKPAGTYLPYVPREYLVHGAGPGRWPVQVREWPEWKQWRRKRDRVYAAHLALCHALLDRRLQRIATKEGWAQVQGQIDPRELMDVRDQSAEDFEDLWQMARIRFADRALELYDPDFVHPKTGQNVRFSTYAATWIFNAIQEWRRLRKEREERQIPLADAQDDLQGQHLAPSDTGAVTYDPAAALDAASESLDPKDAAGEWAAILAALA